MGLVGNLLESIDFYYSIFIHCTNSDFLIGGFVLRDTGL